MKFFLILIISISTYAQTPAELRDMLNGKSFEKYEKMFEDMAKDMEDLDRSQFEKYNKFFDQSILKQLQLLGGERRSYKWTETDSERILSFVGRLDESASPRIEIKDDFFEIEGTFNQNFKESSNQQISKTVISLKVSLPRDIDSSKVRYENKENSFLVIFPKKNISKSIKTKKPLRSPLKENKSGLTI